jgi:hypothetical protein
MVAAGPAIPDRGRLGPAPGAAPAPPGERLPSAAWLLRRLVAFRPWHWAINLLTITGLIVIAMAPGLLTREFFNRLPAALAPPAASGPLDLPSWLWWLGQFLPFEVKGMLRPGALRLQLRLPADQRPLHVRRGRAAAKKPPPAHP